MFVLEKTGKINGIKFKVAFVILINNFYDKEQQVYRVVV